jgi:hypothetical protein
MSDWEWIINAAFSQDEREVRIEVEPGTIDRQVAIDFRLEGEHGAGEDVGVCIPLEIVAELLRRNGFVVTAEEDLDTDSPASERGGYSRG